MKFRKLTKIIVISALAFHLAAESKPFQLKGITLGTSPETSCGNATIFDSYGEMVQKYKHQAPQLLEMGTKECEVEIKTFGGIETTGPAKLLFLDGQLINMKFELSNVTDSNFASLLRVLDEEYGKPKRTVSRPFVTDTWKSRGSTLMVERLGRESGNNDAVIILRQDKGWAVFEQRGEKNSKAFRAMDKAAIKKDI